MKSVKILIDNKIPFIKGALDSIAEVIYLDGSDITTVEVKDADAMIIRTRTTCNASLLKDSNVKCIVTATIGYDHIDTKYCDQHGIFWTNSPGCNSSSVEQYFVSAILELVSNRNLTLNDITLGVVGVGNVGSKVARVAKVLGMNVLLNDPPRKRMEGDNGFVSLQTIQKEADIITFHVPLIMEGNDKTYKMVNGHFFELLAKPVYLINTSRGAVIDEHDLISSLNKRTVISCILDVWEDEPEINTELLSRTEFGTPHIAGYSTDGKANGSSMSVQAVSRFFGLGKDNWTPRDLPLPKNNNIHVDCKNNAEPELIRRIYSETYSILDDDTLLRNNPSRFEYLRGSYRIRREPKAFSVHLNNNPYDKLKRKLESLGFMVFT